MRCHYQNIKEGLKQLQQAGILLRARCSKERSKSKDSSENSSSNSCSSNSSNSSSSSGSGSSSSDGRSDAVASLEAKREESGEAEDKQFWDLFAITTSIQQIYLWDKYVTSLDLRFLRATCSWRLPLSRVFLGPLLAFGCCYAL